jgi:hypothetical protein
MALFQNEFFVKVVTHYKSIAFPLLVPVINQLVENKYHEVKWEIKEIVYED